MRSTPLRWRSVATCYMSVDWFPSQIKVDLAAIYKSPYRLEAVSSRNRAGGLVDIWAWPIVTLNPNYTTSVRPIFSPKLQVWLLGCLLAYWLKDKSSLTSWYDISSLHYLRISNAIKDINFRRVVRWAHDMIIGILLVKKTPSSFFIQHQW